MDHTIHAAQCRQRPADVRLKELKICVPGQMSNISSVARQEIIKADNLMSLTQYQVAQMRRNEARCSGNEKAQKSSSNFIV